MLTLVFENGISELPKFFQIHFDILIGACGKTLFLIAVDLILIELGHVDTFPGTGVQGVYKNHSHHAS